MHAQLASAVCKLRVSGHVLESSPPRGAACLDALLSLSLTAGVVLQDSVYMHRHRLPVHIEWKVIKQRVDK